jgi:glutamyl-tRNA reductase
MRKHSYEKYQSYEEYANDMKRIEMEIALDKIKSGKSIEEVLISYSKRLTDKLIHPIIVSMKKNSLSNYDPEKSREEYFKKFKGDGPKADHVQND